MIELIYISRLGFRLHREIQRQEYERSRIEFRRGTAYVLLTVPVVAALACENGKAPVSPCHLIHRADARRLWSR